MTNLSRRDALAMALAAAGAGIARAEPARPSLDSLAKAKGLTFGSNLGGGPPGTRKGTFSDPRYQRVMIAECGALVPENELKWQALRPGPDAFAFERADALIGFGEAHGMAIRGHTLLWHRSKWFPDWLNKHDFGAHPAVEAERLLTTHIRTVCGRYGPRIRSWDVVNETVMPDTGLMPDTVFSKHLGPQVIDIAFHTAREAAPHALLVYNDYMSWGAGDETHRSGVLKLLERLKASGVPIDALGVQGHIGPDSDGPAAKVSVQETQWRRFIDEVVGMGYRLLITEMDVNDIDLPADPAVRDRMIADYTGGYLDLMLSYPQLGTVMTWGMVDSYSWLQDRLARTDHLPKRPLPYDAAFQPKPMREAMAAAFLAAPARPPLGASA